jgi:hypothetical protein
MVTRDTEFNTNYSLSFITTVSLISSKIYSNVNGNPIKNNSQKNLKKFFFLFIL